jgi:hypothetical protein
MKTAGKFLRISTAEQARIVNEQDFRWPIGQDRPTGRLRGFDFLDWTTTRYGEDAALPHETVNVADWDVVRPHLSMHLSRRMLARTMAVLTELTTTTNYTTGTNYFATGTAQGQDWDASAGNIQKGIQQAQIAIGKATVSVVQPRDITMLCNPTTASLLAQTTEIQAYVKNNPVAPQFLEGDYGDNYGLPGRLWGVGVVVEDAVRVTTQEINDDTYTAGYALADNAVIFVSRPGGFMGADGAPSFSTIQLYVYAPNDMLVETLDEPSQHRTRVGITDQWGAKLVAPASAYYIANVFA